MKKFLLSLLIFAGAFAAVLAFHACSADEAEDQPQHSPQAQLLLRKSREFAKKYNVDMALNEDNIEETAKTLSVEQMEKDYKEWSKTNFTLILNNADPSSKKTINKLRINRRKVSYEDTSISGRFEGHAENNKKIEVTVDYNLGNKGNGLVHVSISYHDCSGFATLQPSGFTSYGGKECSFTAIGTVVLCGPIYCGNYHVVVNKPQYGEMKCTVSKI